MKRKLALIWIVMVLVASTDWAAEQIATENEYPGITEFGQTDGEPLDTGFLFYDGTYVEHPYRVCRKGLAVYVNQIKVVGPLPWPSPKPLELAEDPPMPPGLTTNTTWEQFHKEHYIHVANKVKYTHEHFAKEAHARLRDYFLSLPFMKEATFEHGWILRIATRSGEVELLDVAAPRQDSWDVTPPNREQVLHALEFRRQWYDQTLKAGFCLLRFGAKEECSIQRGEVTSTLPVVFDVLTSRESETVKKSKLQALEVFKTLSADSWPKLLGGFRSSPELTTRIEVLRKQSAGASGSSTTTNKPALEKK